MSCDPAARTPPRTRSGTRKDGSIPVTDAPPLRILHLYRRFRPDFTGDGIYYERLIPLVAEHGSRHEVLVYETLRPDASPSVAAAQQPEQVHYLTAPDGSGGGYRAYFDWMRRNIRRFDVLHIHSHVDRYFLTYLLAQARGCRVIYSSTLDDSVEELVAGYRPGYRRLIRRLMGRLNAFIGISPRLFSGNSPAVGRSRADLIPQGVCIPADPLPDRAAARAALGYGADDVVWLFVGSIIARKAVDFLVAQFATAARDRPGLHLLLVGPATDPAYERQIQAQVAEAGLGERVRHVPFTDDLAAYYAAGDIFVFASHSEGFGNVLLEAMSHRLPVVSRYLPGVTDTFIVHGESGYLFSCPEDFATLTAELAADPGLRARIGDAARRAVIAEYSMETIATQMSELYRSVVSTGSPPVFPAARRAGGCPSLSEGPAALGMTPLPASDGPPVLSIVVDTESEFDWSQGVAADRGSVRAIAFLEALQQACERNKARICYVLDHPVATSPDSVAVIRDFVARGAEIGTHLQPWTAPPLLEPVNNMLAFPGNLPPWLERAKLRGLSDEIAAHIGVRPRVYKAGRYGIGPNTLAMLEDEGFDVDLSVAPHFDYRHEGGPDFTRFDAAPYRFGRDRNLLELPTTSGFAGYLAPMGRCLWQVSEHVLARQVHLRGILDRTGCLSRWRLSPEGHSVAQMIRLTHALRRAGVRHFTLSLHSSSLMPGGSPYVADQAAVDALVGRIDAYLAFFAGEFGGRFASPLDIFEEERRAGRL